NNRMLAVQIGGVLMVLAGIICYFLVSEKQETNDEAKIATLEIEGERSI
ncbi:MAG: MFS transporter, partial [Bacteroidetes bacterium]|nr:MFS transporter [Bacteroidota bacterium]